MIKSQLFFEFIVLALFLCSGKKTIKGLEEKPIERNEIGEEKVNDIKSKKDWFISKIDRERLTYQITTCTTSSF